MVPSVRMICFVSFSMFSPVSEAFYINISDFFFSSLAPFTIIMIPVTIPVASTMIPTVRLQAPVEDMVL